MSILCQKITILRILAKGHIPSSRSRGVQNNANLLLIAKSTLASSTTLSTHIRTSSMVGCIIPEEPRHFFSSWALHNLRPKCEYCLHFFSSDAFPFMPQIHFGIIKSICCSYRLQLRAYFSGRTLIRTL